ncbi:toxin-antitoxin system HicB family antitoxin [bacterium D16-51]|nr:toxin-antitoxin system HicB family antitoxin [bacterium D16-59]RKI53925.1 toxin-antitoxin system HicB family antitoxin [bacterium D16-51]
MKRLVVEMDDELHKAIKMEALRQEVSAKQFVTEILKRELKKQGEQKGD